MNITDSISLLGVILYPILFWLLSRYSKESPFASILIENPSIAEELSLIIDKRRQDTLDKMSRSAKSGETEDISSSGLLNKIRSFFGI